MVGWFSMGTFNDPWFNMNGGWKERGVPYWWLFHWLLVCCPNRKTYGIPFGWCSPDKWLLVGIAMVGVSRFKFFLLCIIGLMIASRDIKRFCKRCYRVTQKNSWFHGIANHPVALISVFFSHSTEADWILYVPWRHVWFGTPWIWSWFHSDWISAQKISKNLGTKIDI